MEAMTTPNVNVAARMNKAIGWLAVLATLILGAALSFRNLGVVEDLGYHLAYGDHFLSTGHIVDSSPEIYTLKESGTRQRSPGGWYDSDGVYHFVMSSWGAEVIMSLVNKFFGVTGLCIMSTSILVACFAMIVITLRRFAAPPIIIAAAIGMAAMAGYERFNLRPELFGYIILLVQFHLLSTSIGRDGKENVLSRKSIAALIALQLVFANVHGTFPLGLATTGAFLAGTVLTRLLPDRDNRDDQSMQAVAANIKRMAFLLLCQIAVCFINPWTWRPVILLPLELVSMISTMNAASAQIDQTHMPAPYIIETRKTFDLASFYNVKATYVFIGTLALTVLGIVASAIARRWRLLIFMLGMTAMAISLRRQMPLGAFLMLISASAAITLLVCHRWKVSSSGRTLNAIKWASAVAIVATAGWFVWLTASNRLYVSEFAAARFATGISRVQVPLDAAEWITQNAPKGRIWNDFGISSNLYYFTNPHPEVSIITNALAYPQDIFGMVCWSFEKKNLLDDAVRKYSIQILAMCHIAPVATSVAADHQWTLVNLSAKHLLFVKTHGPNAELARKFGITEDALDINEYAAKLRAMDVEPYFAIRCGVETLYSLGWYRKAILLAEMIPPQEHTYISYQLYGSSLVCRGTWREISGDYKGREDWKLARKCFEKSLELDPTRNEGKAAIESVDVQLKNRELGLAQDCWTPPGFNYAPTPPSTNTRQGEH